jgi:hypothetical protein
VPRLLPEETIERIKMKCKTRKTWEHGNQKYEYLFSRIIFDKDSGFALTGTPNGRGKRYYRTYKGNSKCYMINADTLEKAIIEEIFNAFGSDREILKAVFNDMPTASMEVRLQESLKSYQKDLEKIRKKQKNLIEAITNYGDDEKSPGFEALSTSLMVLDKQYEDVNFKYQAAMNQIATLPSREEIKERRAFISRCLELRMMEDQFRIGLVFDDMSFRDKQNLIRLILGGHDDFGKRYGVYIRRMEGRPIRYHFEAYGRLGNLEGWIEKKIGKHFASSDILLRRHEAVYCQRIAGILKTGHPDFFTEYFTKAHMLRQRHAHYRLGLHQ